MGSRGPKPAGQKKPANLVPRKRPRPLPGMSGPARQVWKRIINSLDYDFFDPHHLDLLRVYCEAAARHKEATRHINAEGAVITQANGVVKANPWCAIEVAAASTMAQAGTKLGITRNNTVASRGGKSKEPKKPSSKWEGLIGGSRSS